MPKKSEQKVLEIKNLTVQFTSAGFVNTAVDAVDLDVYKGEIVGLVGESGSGKTTIGRSVLCLNSYSVGEVALLDRILPKDNNKVTMETNKWMARNVQMVFQDPASSLHPNRKIGAIVSEGLYNQSGSTLFVSRREVRERQLLQSDFACRAGIDLLSQKEAAKVLAEEEASQLTALRDSFPWSAVQNDWKMYCQERHDRESNAVSQVQLETIAEGYDQLYENRAFYKTTLSLARKEKFIIGNQKKSTTKVEDYAKVDRKVMAAIKNYRERKVQIFDQLDKDVASYKASLKEYDSEHKQLIEGSFDPVTLERYASDFAKLRDKYLREVQHYLDKFERYRATLKASARTTSDLETHQKRLQEYDQKHAPLTRRQNVDKRVNQMLHSVQLGKEYVSRYPGQLSGGQQQRVGVARAIALKPKLLVADEPISSLDVSIQAQVVNIIKDLNRQENLSVLFIAHDLRMVRYISDRIAVMHRGRIVEVGTADEVYNSPFHPYTRNLLNAVPSIEKIGESLSSKSKVEFARGYDQTFYWYWCSKDHKVLATPEEAALWKIPAVRKEESHYVAIR